MKYTGASAFICLFLAGCGPGSYSDQVQICLGSSESLSELARMVEAMAKSNGQKFVQRSEETRRDAEVINEAKPGATDLSRPVVNMGFHRRDGLGITVYSDGMPGYQVIVAIDAGENKEETLLLKRSVIATLSKKWAVYEVPADRGAKPLAGCG